MPIQGIVQNVAAGPSAVDGSNPFISQGKAQEMLVAEIRGKYYTAAYRGNCFKTSVPAAATLTIPTTLATLASKWCLVNPAGSVKNLALIRVDYFVNSATEVVNVIGITKSTGTAAALTTTTAGVINNTNIGGANALASQAQFFTAATHADTPVWFASLFGINATAVGLFVNSYIFDDYLQIAPNNMIDMVASVGAQANSLADAVWAEWPQ